MADDEDSIDPDNLERLLLRRVIEALDGSPLDRVRRLHVAVRDALPQPDALDELALDDRRFIVVVALLSHTAQTVGELELALTGALESIEQLRRTIGRQ